MVSHSCCIVGNLEIFFLCFDIPPRKLDTEIYRSGRTCQFFTPCKETTAVAHMLHCTNNSSQLFISNNVIALRLDQQNTGALTGTRDHTGVPTKFQLHVRKKNKKPQNLGCKLNEDQHHQKPWFHQMSVLAHTLNYQSSEVAFTHHRQQAPPRTMAITMVWKRLCSVACIALWALLQPQYAEIQCLPIPCGTGVIQPWLQFKAEVIPSRQAASILIW